LLLAALADNCFLLMVRHTGSPKGVQHGKAPPPHVQCGGAKTYFLHPQPFFAVLAGFFAALAGFLVFPFAVAMCTSLSKLIN
jgi:hypothetical protein